MTRSRSRFWLIVLGFFVVLLAAGGVVLQQRGVIAKVRQIGVQRLVTKVWNRVRRDGVMAVFRGAVGQTDAPKPEPTFTLTYSIFDPQSGPPVEDSAARAALPEFVDVPAANLADLGPSIDTARTFDRWHRSGGDAGSTKYSALKQITVANVRYLEPAWSYTSGSDLGDSTKTGGLTVETNPIVVGNRMFLSTIDGDLVSLDAATGKEVWRLALPAPVARRGLVWEPNASFAKSRLFVPTRVGVYAVNAAAGTVIKSFGKDGVVGDATTLIAPLLVDGHLIIATVAPAVEAYDLATGALRWSRSLLVKPDGTRSALAGASPWGGMSADVQRGTIFVSTGNPRPALIGKDRHGKNDYSSSVVAIDARTGAVRWSFQDVEHDLWDLDIPAAPILTSITREGRRIDVVAALTKRGNTLLLDRDRGQPIFAYRRQRTPVSAIPGEQTAAYQPVFDLPEPFARQVLTPDEITDLSDSASRTVTRKLRFAKYGFFVPPQMGGKIAYYGVHGGAEWPGGAVDPTRGILYVPSNQIPWVIRTQYTDVKATKASGADLQGDAVYQQSCARCHGGSRGGSFEWEGTGDAYFPALTGITALRSRDSLESPSYFRAQHEGTTVGTAPSADVLKTLYGYFAELDRRADRQRSFALSVFWQLVLDGEGNPGSKAPWGQLTALDLNTGRKLWQVPFGQMTQRDRSGQPVRGLQNMGGVAATAGGVLFATGTTDNMVRAFDAANGTELWSHSLPAAGSTMPTVYEVNGVQYVVIVATGGVFRGYSGRSDRVIAFRLPAARR